MGNNVETHRGGRPAIGSSELDKKNVESMKLDKFFAG
jgi:hypothetical protein